jgi:hypothetical protein
LTRAIPPQDHQQLRSDRWPSWSPATEIALQPLAPIAHRCLSSVGSTHVGSTHTHTKLVPHVSCVVQPVEHLLLLHPIQSPGDRATHRIGLLHSFIVVLVNAVLCHSLSTENQVRRIEGDGPCECTIPPRSLNQDAPGSRCDLDAVRSGGYRGWVWHPQDYQPGKCFVVICSKPRSIGSPIFPSRPKSRKNSATTQPLARGTPREDRGSLLGA